MKVDVGEQIAALLMEYDQVHIPGLGALIAHPKPASLDGLQGQLSPPSKVITFDENLQADDGLLSDAIRQRFNISLLDANNVVQQYVGNIRASLERGEIVMIPQVGRLYRDYDRKLVFNADNHNYNADAFGLPPVHATPLPNPEPLATPTPTYGHSTGASNAAFVPDPAPAVRTAWWVPIYEWGQRNLTLIGAAVVILLVMILLYRFLPNFPSTGTQPDPNAGNLTNNPPLSNYEDSLGYDDPIDFPTDPGSEEEALLPETTPPTNPTPTPTKPKPTAPQPSPGQTLEPPLVGDGAELNGNGRNATPPKADPAPAKSVAPPVKKKAAPAAKTARIAIGLFKEPDNVAALVKRIKAAGMEAYTEKVDAGTRVGVQFAYASEADITKKLAAVRAQFEPGAFVVKR